MLQSQTTSAQGRAKNNPYLPRHVRGLVFPPLRGLLPSLAEIVCRSAGSNPSIGFLLRRVSLFIRASFPAHSCFALVQHGRRDQPPKHSSAPPPTRKAVYKLQVGLDYWILYPYHNPSHSRRFLGCNSLQLWSLGSCQRG